MIIRAFGTGMKLESGYFNSGWQGMLLAAAAPVSWRPQSSETSPVYSAIAVTPMRWRPAAAAMRPVYSSAPVKQMLWEES